MSDQMPVNAEEIMAVIERNDTARLRAWLKTCTSCGLCSESCFFYMANDDNPEFMPQYKARKTLGELIKNKGKVTREQLEEMKEIAWAKCTMCRRCSQYCPFGIEIAVMINVARQCMRTQNVCPDRLMTIDQSYVEFGNQMSIPDEEFVETCEWMAEEGQDRLNGLEIPIDKEDTDIMFVVNSREPKYYPQDIQEAAMVMHAAGENWTMPSHGWEATNLSMFSGNLQVAGMVAQSVYDAAKKLNAKKICITECGHAYRAAKYEGPYWTKQPNGQPPVEVTHAVALFHSYMKEGKIKLKHKFHDVITYQHPCNLSRSGDLGELGDELMEMLCEKYVPMEPHREWSHCCCGGGGFIPMGADYKKTRMIAGKVKAEQIQKTGAKFVLVPCHNCTDQINDLNKEYDLGIKVMSFKELICELMELPPHMKPEGEEDE
ncbi:(Fe-S)-binding protein [Fundidesulfovibrio putealis]|uniref:(Fe-S)-binding protein n=1 Tax=Fundidesulfovibrio putealis TaxID=270496 RepID=UPI0004108EA1|nr:(Fe-S)-binding protein [Fundidesulfovibrio putealis]